MNLWNTGERKVILLMVKANINLSQSDRKKQIKVEGLDWLII